MSSTCPHNMVNFGPLAAEIVSLVWDTLQISTGFASWQRYCTASSSGRPLNFAALNRGWECAANDVLCCMVCWQCLEKTVITTSVH